MAELHERLNALQTRLEESERENQRLRNALELLHSVQNGCPLPTYQADWDRAMEMTERLLGLAPTPQDHLPDVGKKAEPYRYLCERCGGIGVEPRGAWTGKAYDSVGGGPCADCGGSGKLGEPPKVRRFKDEYGNTWEWDGTWMTYRPSYFSSLSMSDIQERINRGECYEIDADGNRIETPEVKP